MSEPCIFDDVVKTDEDHVHYPLPTKSLHSPIVIHDEAKALYYSQINSPTRNKMSTLNSMSGGNSNLHK